ncbi:hypothetical protein EYF80_047628 [Liparis tanakae]|uniref:Uncharacterized protein n=1 Tax=Liparis tanakae TaxID=230148 RepID=A0A4Z2FPF0_9TELE|nr:hypothetical protein EYF80_047628 [Liparis tanakae]
MTYIMHLKEQKGNKLPHKSIGMVREVMDDLTFRLFQASALSMSSVLPPSAAAPPALRGSLRAAPCAAGLLSSKVAVLQEKSRSLVRTASIGPPLSLSVVNFTIT